MCYRLADRSQAERLNEAAAPDRDVALHALPADRRDAPWGEIYLDLLTCSDAIVCLVGPTTAESPNVTWELDEAARRGLPIIFSGLGADELSTRYPGSHIARLEGALDKVREIA